MARPNKPIDWQRVEELLEANCHGTEIASIYGMHPNTFYDRVVQEYGMSFTEFSTRKKETGNAYLREAQYLKALDKDNTMLVWLGKNRLNQSDKSEVVYVSDELKKFDGQSKDLVNDSK